MQQLGLLRSQCNADSDPLIAVFASALPAIVDNKAPDWVELVPAGPEINAVDGRKFRNTSPDSIVAAFKADQNDLAFDWEHSTEIKAPKGEHAPASGWIKELANRAGAIWARVEWTAAGAADLIAKSYKYASPGFMHDKAGNIVALTSAGLTNRPAFRMTALAQTETKKDENPMDKVLKALLARLGLKSKATEDEVLAAMAAADQKATDDLAAAVASAQPTLDKFVPRADYEQAVAQVSELKAGAAKIVKDALEAEIDKEIETAVAAFKVAPASVEFYRASCSAEGGLDRFREFIKDAPAVIKPGEANLTKPKGDGSGSLTAEQAAVAAACGQTPEEFATGAVE